MSLQEKEESNLIDITEAVVATSEVVFQQGTTLDEIEKSVILETLKHNSYNRTHAARVLGIGIRTLQRKLKKYGAAGLGLKKAYSA